MYEIKTTVNIRDWDAVTRAAMQNTARNIVELGRQNMASAGRFNKKQINTLRSKVTKSSPGGWIIDISFRKLGFLKIFEYGGSSIGKPMLWIPAPGRAIPTKVRAYPGKLFRPGRKGAKKNVLMSTQNKQVMYIGVPAVNIRPRFNLRNIAYNEASRFLEFFKQLAS